MVAQGVPAEPALQTVYLVSGEGNTAETYPRKSEAFARAREIGRRAAEIVRIRRARGYETRQKVWPVQESIYSNGHL
jgi:hypothetical protein